MNGLGCVESSGCSFQVTTNHHIPPPPHQVRWPFCDSSGLTLNAVVCWTLAGELAEVHANGDGQVIEGTDSKVE